MADVAARVSQDTDTADPCEGEELYEDEVRGEATIAVLGGTLSAYCTTPRRSGTPMSRKH